LDVIYSFRSNIFCCFWAILKTFWSIFSKTNPCCYSKLELEDAWQDAKYSFNMIIKSGVNVRNVRKIIWIIIFDKFRPNPWVFKIFNSKLRRFFSSPPPWHISVYWLWRFPQSKFLAMSGYLFSLFGPFLSLWKSWQILSLKSFNFVKKWPIAEEKFILF